MSNIARFIHLWFVCFCGVPLLTAQDSEPLKQGLGTTQVPASASSVVRFFGADQIEVHIDGPGEMGSGDLVILTVDSNANQYAWFLGNSDKPFLAVENGRKVVFSSGTPGKYKFCCVAINSVEGTYGQAIYWVTIKPQHGPGPTPPDPGPHPPGPPDPVDPVDPLPNGLAKNFYDSALKVKSENRKKEAVQFAQIFRGVASRAAGLQQWGPQKIIDETSRRINEEIPIQTRNAWLVWRDDFAKILQSQSLSIDDKSGHIDIWKQVATGLEAVK